MGLSDAVIDNIIQDKIRRLEAYNENVAEYETNLNNILRDEFPLSDFSKAALMQLQNGLSLSNEVTEGIKNKVLSNPVLDSAYSWYDRGRGQYELKNYEKAIEYYTKAIEKNEAYSGAYFERGYNYNALQNYKESIADYTKAIEYNKNWEVGCDLNLAYFERGRSYYGIQPQTDDNLTMAQKDWSKCIEQNPADYNAYWNRGLAYQYFRNFDKAIADFKKSFEMDKTDTRKASKATVIVKCYSELGDLEEIDKWTKTRLELLNQNTNAVNSSEKNNKENK